MLRTELWTSGRSPRGHRMVMSDEASNSMKRCANAHADGCGQRVTVSDEAHSVASATGIYGTCAPWWGGTQGLVNSRRSAWTTSPAVTGWPLRHGGDRVDREGVGDSQAEQLHQAPCARADLDPPLEHDARVLPEMVQAPPPLQVVNQRFDTPSARVELDDRWRVQTAFRGNDQAGLCPCLPLLVKELAPHGRVQEGP
jgi:hypothetical protein